MKFYLHGLHVLHGEKFCETLYIMKTKQNITIVGAGVVGLSIAYELSTIF